MEGISMLFYFLKNQILLFKCHTKSEIIYPNFTNINIPLPLSRSMTEKKSIVGPPPAEYNTVVPYLVVHRADELMAFLKEAFGAEERMRFNGQDGSITHAECSLGNSVIMLCDANASNSAAPTNINLHVSDVDSVYDKAMKAEASSVREPSDQLHGERTAVVKDSAGNQWWISTQIEKLSPEEIGKRMENARKK